MRFSQSNLIDRCTVDNSFFEAAYRPWGGTPHALTAVHCAFWNITGKGNKRDYSVHTQQSRYGYVVGTQGEVSTVRTSARGNTAEKTVPVDYVEGIGDGAQLEPVSLYLDQRNARLNQVSTPGNPPAKSHKHTVTAVYREGSILITVRGAPKSKLSIEADIYDYAGRRIAEINNSTSHGHRMVWRPKTKDGANLVRGTYVLEISCRTSNGTVRQSVPFCALR
jgi:hypothetical protein